jgi:hypothetical protein
MRRDGEGKREISVERGRGVEDSTGWSERTTMKTLMAMLLLGLLAPTGASKPAARMVDRRPLVMVGKGARVKDGNKLYDMEMWIDDEDGRRAFPALAMRAQGRDKKHLRSGDHGPKFLVWGRFTKQAVFKFARAVPAATMRKEIEEIKAQLEEMKDTDEEMKGADQVVALFAADAGAGGEWVLTTRDNGEIALRIGEGEGDGKQGPQSPKLQRALWDVWLGPKPLSTELRQHLIENLNTLGR